MFKIIVAGSRGFDNYQMLHDKLQQITHNYDNTQLEIVSGTARGADQLGERYAAQYNIKLTKFPADWDTFGRSAGYRRNKQMAEYADACIVFWDGVSRGTQHMIKLANEAGLLYTIVKY